MPRILYTHKKFGEYAEGVIHQANRILNEYQAQGYQLTLRQLYYQFVSRDLLPNTQKDYKKLGTIINDARLAGLIDWEAIIDRTRNLESLPHWGSPQDIIDVVARQYRTERWASQPRRVEVWIEKDALVGVIEGVCESLDVPYFSCRGYTSQSELWAAAQRVGRYLRNGQGVTILHLGDHDPSGKDMTRDIEDRMRLFVAQDWYNAHNDIEAKHSAIFADIAGHTGQDFPLEVERIALNWDQVMEYEPPPNPAKITDTRAKKYIEEFGDESWELDALEPAVITDLIQTNVERLLDDEAWDEATNEMEAERRDLQLVSDQWQDVLAHLRAQNEDD